MKKITSLIVVCVVTLILMGNQSYASDQHATGKKKFLFHVKTSLEKDDAQICVVPNVAWAALKKGHEVTLLFDASAVTSVKKGGFFDSTTTPMDEADLPERERKALAKQFDFPIKQIPHNYGEYLKFIKEKGAKLFINGTMMLLYKYKPEQMDTNLEIISLIKMIDLIAQADIYAAY